MAELICIREPGHPKIPPHLVACEYGPETVVDTEGRPIASGVSVYLRGPTEEIRAWIKDAGGKIWCSENPMLGVWTLHTVHPEEPKT